jgi:5-methylcytosine-specific restriction protein A
MPVRPPSHRPQGWTPPVERRRLWERERERGSAAERGYDRNWQKLRLVILNRDPFCLFCQRENKLTASTQVDHIKPISERPDLRLDPANLRGLCESCHSRRTADYQRGDVY